MMYTYNTPPNYYTRDTCPSGPALDVNNKEGFTLHEGTYEPVIDESTFTICVPEHLAEKLDPLKVNALIEGIRQLDLYSQTLCEKCIFDNLVVYIYDSGVPSGIDGFAPVNYPNVVFIDISEASELIEENIGHEGFHSKLQHPNKFVEEMQFVNGLTIHSNGFDARIVDVIGLNSNFDAITVDGNLIDVSYQFEHKGKTYNLGDQIPITLGANELAARLFVLKLNNLPLSFENLDPIIKDSAMQMYDFFLQIDPTMSDQEFLARVLNSYSRVDSQSIFGALYDEFKQYNNSNLNDNDFVESIVRGLTVATWNYYWERESTLFLNRFSSVNLFILTFSSLMMIFLIKKIRNRRS